MLAKLELDLFQFGVDSEPDWFLNAIVSGYIIPFAKLSSPDRKYIKLMKNNVDVYPGDYLVYSNGEISQLSYLDFDKFFRNFVTARQEKEDVNFVNNLDSIKARLSEIVLDIDKFELSGDKSETMSFGFKTLANLDEINTNLRKHVKNYERKTNTQKVKF